MIYTLQATLLCSVDVEAETLASAEEQLKARLATPGVWLTLRYELPGLVGVGLEGDLDLVETRESEP